ncbi:heavy-metal-associated domain-containing protein [Herbaspirillum sp. alder98]|uniref:heavy-metal-associated domain-containing protein n=1 Tax=Herbaspirillum sp. alder98 TaxID=2913096 RepID=UPI001CD8C4D2|nr:heavy-metal-associated domain-containing protein [Herbaspirillum sp. alder98]MCA1325516.1 heavy-metal-associated domain-containing protein [Herbaspirillum sp. alder98]
MPATFTVNDMTCNHCAGVITKAVKALDANARVDITVADKRVVIDSALPAQSFADAIEDAGYTPVAA